MGFVAAAGGGRWIRPGRSTEAQPGLGLPPSNTLSAFIIIGIKFDDDDDDADDEMTR